MNFFLSSQNLKDGASISSSLAMIAKNVGVPTLKRMGKWGEGKDTNVVFVDEYFKTLWKRVTLIINCRMNIAFINKLINSYEQNIERMSE